MNDKNGVTVFKDVRRFESDNPAYKQGFHTFNYYQGISVVDAKGFRFPIVNKVFCCARKIMGKK